MEWKIENIQIKHDFLSAAQKFGFKSISQLTIFSTNLDPGSEMTFSKSILTTFTGSVVFKGRWVAKIGSSLKSNHNKQI